MVRVADSLLMNLYSSESDDDDPRSSKTTSSIIICIENGATQVDDSGNRIPQDSSGKMRESHRILQESTENRWNMEAVFRPKIVWIFPGGFLSTSCAFRQEPARNHREKSEKFLAGILLPQNHRNYPEPAVSGPGCSTWGSHELNINEYEFFHE